MIPDGLACLGLGQVGKLLTSFAAHCQRHDAAMDILRGVFCERVVTGTVGLMEDADVDNDVEQQNSNASECRNKFDFVETQNIP